MKSHTETQRDKVENVFLVLNLLTVLKNLLTPFINLKTI